MENNFNLHDTLISVANDLPKENITLALSSGVDSQAVFYAMLEAGIDFTVTSFTLDDRESKDFKTAKKTAEDHGIKFTPIYLPTNIDNLKKETRIMINDYNCVKKTEVECCWCWYHLFNNIKEKYVVTGEAAGEFFALSKRGVLHFKNNVEDYRKEAREKYVNGEDAIIDHIASLVNKKKIDFYNNEKFDIAFAGKSWDDRNKPRQKWPLRMAYEEVMKLPNAQGFQKGDSGISDLFAKLLETDWNIKGWKNPIGIYNAIRNKVI